MRRCFHNNTRMSLIAATTLMLSLMSCDKNESPANVHQGSEKAYIGVTVGFNNDNSSLKGAITNGQKDVAGTDIEQAVLDGKGYLFFNDMPGWWLPLHEKSGVYESDLITLTPSEGMTELKLSFLLNNPYRLEISDYLKTKTVPLTDLLKVTNDNTALLMTTVVDSPENTKSIDITATEDEVKSGAKNNYSFNVERLVSKVQITQKAGLSMELPAGTLISPMTFSMAGSAREIYLFTNEAGSRTLDPTANKAIYKGFKSVIDTKTVATNWNPKDGHPFLQRVSDKVAGTDEYILNGYYRNPQNVVDAEAEPTSINTGFYFFENSMFGGENVGSKKGEIKYNRIAYAKVYVRFATIKGWKRTADGNGIEEGTWGTGTDTRRSMVPVPSAWYNANRANPKYKDHLWLGTYPGLDGAAYIYEVIDQPKTFYMCMDDGEIFDTPEAAYLYYKGFPKNLRKYENGKMVYLLPINAQKNITKNFINYCDTRRNNIYDIRIDYISGLGRNYDPVDPDDPNIPMPEDNPFEPPTDPQIPVEPYEYTMQITGKVLGWNKVTKSYILQY